MTFNSFRWEEIYEREHARNESEFVLAIKKLKLSLCLSQIAMLVREGGSGVFGRVCEKCLDAFVLDA